MSQTTIDLKPPAGDHTKIAGDPRVRAAMLAALGAGAAAPLLVWLIGSGHLDLQSIAVRLLVDALLLLCLIGYISLTTRAAVAQLRREIAADIVQQVSAVVASRVIARFDGELERVVEQHLAEPVRQLYAELARVKAMAGGTGLHPDDPALLPGQRASGRAYASMALADGRVQSLADGQERLAGTVSELGGELAKMRLLVEHAIVRGAAGAPRPQTPRVTGRHPQDAFDAELRGYLTRVYEDDQRGDDL